MTTQTDSATAPETPGFVDYEELRRRWKISKAQMNLDIEKSQDDDANAAFLDRHDRTVADIIATIEQCESPETPEEAAELIGFARLLMDDREGSVLDDDVNGPLRMLLDKAYRGRWKDRRPSASDNRTAMLSAFQGLEGTIRDLAVLARVAAAKTIELSPNYASLSPEELEFERRNLDDAMSLVTQVERKAAKLEEQFDEAWGAKS